MWCRWPDSDLPVVLPEDVSFDKPGNALIIIRPGSTYLPECGGKAQREPTPWTVCRLILVFRALHRSLERESADYPTRRQRMLPVDQYIAASSTRSCICCTAASSPAR